MRQFTINNLQLTILIATVIFFLLLTLYPKPFTLNPTFAQTPPCGTATPARATGLVSTPQLQSGSKFSTLGGCTIDPKAAFAPFKIPTYDDLKSIYFTQSRLPSSGASQQKYTVSGNQTQAYFTATNLARDSLHHIGGNLTISIDLAAALPKKMVAVFVDGDLNFNIPTAPKQFTYGDDSSGMVFVVKGKINIAPAVTQIDAVLIGDGIDANATACASSTAGATCYSICTALDTAGSCPRGLDDTPNQSRLVINGSLISLNPSYPIRFRRDLRAGNQATPAERINHHPKYLVLLRHLLSDTLQRWSEIP